MTKILVIVPSVRSEHWPNILQQAKELERDQFTYIVVANSAEVEELAKASGMPYISEGINLGFAGSVAAAVSRHSDWNWIVLLNDDFVLFTGAGDLLKTELTRNLAASIVYFDPEPYRYVPKASDVFQDLSLLRRIVNKSSVNTLAKPRAHRIRYKSFSFVAIRRDCWTSVGGLDVLFPFTYEDADFVKRATGSNFRADESETTSLGTHLHSQSSKTLISFVLPINAWSGRVFLEKSGYSKLLSRGVVFSALISRLFLVPFAVPPNRQHALAILKSIRVLGRTNAPLLPPFGLLED